MLFGHIEKPEDRIAHMRMLRDLQDEAPGFFAFIPLVYHPEHNALHKIVPNITCEEDILRTVAVAISPTSRLTGSRWAYKRQ